MAEIQSICILRLSAIGDCCHTLAVIRTLQAQLPDAEFTWLIGKTEAGLMRSLDGIELVVYDKKGGRSSRREVAKQLEGREFDVLLNMHASWRANRVSRLIRAKRKIGFDRGRARDFQWLFSDERISQQHQPHVIDGMFGFAEQIGVKTRELRWDLPLQESHLEFAKQLLTDASPTLLISPCSSDRSRNFRNWPAERFAEAARFAADRYGAQIVVTGGGRALELDYAEAILSEVAEAVNLVGKTSLKELAALIQRSTAVLCPDSGPAHIATAVGTPVIGLYATSNPGRTGPIESKQYVVNRYPEACRQYLSADVGDIRWGRRVRHPDAMNLIELKQVTAKIDLLFGH